MGSYDTSCLTSLSSFRKFSLDTLYVSTAKHVFEKNLKPKLLKSAQARSSVMSKEVDKLVQTLESYLLSIVNPEWAVAIAISLTQEIPEGGQTSLSRDVGYSQIALVWVLSPFCRSILGSLQGLVLARPLLCPVCWFSLPVPIC